MVEESFGIYVTRNSVGGSKKKALCMARDTLHDNIISLVFLSISCKVADSPPPHPYVFC